MRIFVASGRGEIGKFRGVVKSFPHIWKGKVLDVGCRSRNLRKVIPRRSAEYCGIDLNSPADVLGSLEVGLPFGCTSFHTVVALDVLEHTNTIHKAINELCRVSKQYVLITLPNIYELILRIKFLFGKPLSGKYGLPPDPPSDRHRWLFSLREAKDFVQVHAFRNDFRVANEGCFVGLVRNLPGIRFTVGCFPNLLAPSYVALLERV